MKNIFKRNKKVVLNEHDRKLLEYTLRLLQENKGHKTSSVNLYRMVYQCSAYEALQEVEKICK